MARLNSSPIRQYRGTTAQHAAYTGPSGELTVDTDKNVVVVQDGTTAGGHPMAREDRKIIGSGGVTINGGSEATLAGDITIEVSGAGSVSAGDGIIVDENVVQVDQDWLDQKIADKTTNAECVTYTGTQVIKDKPLVLYGTCDEGSGAGQTRIMARTPYCGNGLPSFGLYVVDSEEEIDPCAYTVQDVPSHIAIAFVRGYDGVDYYNGWTISTNNSFLQVSHSRAGLFATPTYVKESWNPDTSARDPVITGSCLNSFIQAGDGITVDVTNKANDHKAVVAVDSEWLGTQISSAIEDAFVAGDGLSLADDSVSVKAGTGITVDEYGVSVNETWLEGKIDSALTDAVSGGLVIAGTGIDVAVSGGNATVSVDETWLNEQIDDAIAEVGSEYDIPLYFDNNSGTTEWGEVHTFLPENASTIKLVASEADGSGTSGITITLAGDISASATSITLGSSEASCAALAGKAVVFTISGSSDQTKVSLLALCALA